MLLNLGWEWVEGEINGIFFFYLNIFLIGLVNLIRKDISNKLYLRVCLVWFGN